MSTKIIAAAVLEAAINENTEDLRATLKALLDSHASKAISECDCDVTEEDFEDEDEDENEDEDKK